MSESGRPHPSDLTSTFDGGADIYDHAISLVDTTAPVSQSRTRTRSPSPESSNLARKVTKGSVRERIARRKYAKWRQERYASKTNSLKNDEGIDEEGAEHATVDDSAQHSAQASDSEAINFAHQQKHKHNGDQKNIDKKKDHRHHEHKHQEEVDILYENQRGMFFCGIPLYSHSSLLQFDPSPWVTKDLKDSAVNITNAQVPDPSWVWAWKNWYVDMSYDVDEEGWQYSFMFGNRFGWHGSHPWFHSFARRRRWLRKRVKVQNEATIDKGRTMGAAHHLNTDYFTIHPKRDPSPVSALDSTVQTARPSSYISHKSTEPGSEIPEDITSAGGLLKALRLASVDREKIDLVKKFVHHGGEELAYLKNLIPEVMSLLVFQNSKKQLLVFLKDTANDAQKHRDEHEAEDKPEGDTEKQRIDNILAAIDAADKQIHGLEYWSDRKNVLRTVESSESSTQSVQMSSRPSTAGFNNDPVGAIRGISSNADIGKDPNESNVLERTRRGTNEEKSRREEKGKGKANEESDSEDMPSRLEADALFIPGSP